MSKEHRQLITGPNGEPLGYLHDLDKFGGPVTSEDVEEFNDTPAIDLDALVRTVIKHASELTNELRARLAELLNPPATSGEDASSLEINSSECSWVWARPVRAWLLVERTFVREGDIVCVSTRILGSIQCEELFRCEGIVFRWVPYSREGVKLDNGYSFPHSAQDQVERKLGISHVGGIGRVEVDNEE